MAEFSSCLTLSYPQAFSHATVNVTLAVDEVLILELSTVARLMLLLRKNTTLKEQKQLHAGKEERRFVKCHQELITLRSGPVPPSLVMTNAPPSPEWLTLVHLECSHPCMQQQSHPQVFLSALTLHVPAGGSHGAT